MNWGWYHSSGGWENPEKKHGKKSLEEINFFRPKWTKLDEMPQGAKSSFMCQISMVHMSHMYILQFH